MSRRRGKIRRDRVIRLPCGAGCCGNSPVRRERQGEVVNGKPGLAGHDVPYAISCARLLRTTPTSSMKSGNVCRFKQNTITPKKVLKTRVGSAGLRRMTNTMKTPDCAQNRRYPADFLKGTPPSATSKRQYLPPFPVLRSGPKFVSGATRQKQFLAANLDFQCRPNLSARPGPGQPVGQPQWDQRHWALSTGQCLVSRTGLTSCKKIQAIHPAYPAYT